MFALEDIPAFLPDLLRGAGLTILVSVLAFLLALVVGLAFAILRMSRIVPLRVIAAIYIQFIRGTPLLLQLFFIYYVMPYSGVVLSPFVSAIIGLTANYGAYMAEVFRSGIQAIAKGQWEAGSAVGMSRRLLMRRIILPQAIRIVIPTLGNYFIGLFKDTALCSVVSIQEVVFTAQILAARNFQYFTLYTVVGVMYFSVSFPAARFVAYLERITSRGYRRKPIAVKQP